MARKRQKASAEIKPISYSQCPAKTYMDSSGTHSIGRTVFNHCQIVGEVAKELIRRSPSKSLYPKGAAFTAATHDIGKVSPTFYSKLYVACGLDGIPNINPNLERQWGGHAGVSQLTANAMAAPQYVPEILGQHHGFAPDVSGRRANDSSFGGESWQLEREKLVHALEQCLDESWPRVKNFAESRLIAGLTSVSDWIGSGEFFENPNDDWQPKVHEALDNAGFITPIYNKGLSFEQVFGFQPRKAQSLLIDSISKPGVYVLEAPMGVGKTEAALYAAYQMLSTEQASGVYFALPTQLTSNKIYERFNRFLKSILSDKTTHRSLLLHGNAWLFEMGEEGQPGGAWFNQAKRGLLAPFAVGTIDQALMAAMNVKHGFVRAFGLAGKAVILDEVHTYDSYTGTILDALIDLLQQLDCTVIILSATLSQDRRRGLLALQGTSLSDGYPLISALPKQANIKEIEVPVTESRSIKTHFEGDSLKAVEEALKRAEQGQQVLWIENTVKEAQERYLDIAARAAEINVDCGLLHSRFTLEDRQNIENHWVNLFGKEGWQQRGEKGRILIGTQVLEQSLDIDADFLVSRFAPTDMLLQRLGRLWRHDETPRNVKAISEAWLLTPPLEKAIESPRAAFDSTAYVYSPYVLCRSLEVWQGMKEVSLPEDMRELIESTYKVRAEQEKMAQWLHELDEGSRYNKGRNALHQLARITLAETGNTLPESRAQTRYSEADSFEVLLLTGIHYNEEEQAGVLSLLNGEKVALPINKSKYSRRQWREVAAKLMRQVVQVRMSDAPQKLPKTTLQKFGLQHCFFLGSDHHPDDESVLRLALVDEASALKGIEHYDIHDKYELEYRNDIGYRMIKD